MVLETEVIFNVAYFTLELVAFFFGVIGNSIVVYAMASEKKLRRQSNIYILSVAAADLLIGLVAIPAGVVNVGELTETFN